MISLLCDRAFNLWKGVTHENVHMPPSLPLAYFLTSGLRGRREHTADIFTLQPFGI